MANKKLTDLSTVSSIAGSTLFLVDDGATTQTANGNVIKNYIYNSFFSTTLSITNDISSTGNLTANNITANTITSTSFKGNIVNGNSNIVITANGNINFTATSSDSLTVSSTGITVTGNITYNPTYGLFDNNANISLPTANTATPVLFNNTMANYQVQLGTGASNSHVIFDKAGTYRVKYTCALVSTSNQGVSVYFWLQKNGVNVPYSTTQNTLSTKNTQYTVTSDFIVVNVSLNDYIELYWASATTAVSMVYTAPTTTPWAMPANPSVTIMVMPVGA